MTGAEVMSTDAVIELLGKKGLKTYREELGPIKTKRGEVFERRAVEGVLQRTLQRSLAAFVPEAEGADWTTGAAVSRWAVILPTGAELGLPRRRIDPRCPWCGAELDGLDKRGRCCGCRKKIFPATDGSLTTADPASIPLANGGALDDHGAFITARVRDRSGLNPHELFEELVRRGYTGSEVTVIRRVREIRSSKTKAPAHRQGPSRVLLGHLQGALEGALVRLAAERREAPVSSAPRGPRPRWGIETREVGR